VRRRLIQPARSSLPAEDAFRFVHILIRDAAYGGIAKETRAELHKHFADWLGERERPFEEIVGYHLEQAYRYRAELSPNDPALRALGDRASESLAQAGHGALLRGDNAAAVSLLDGHVRSRVTTRRDSRCLCRSRTRFRRWETSNRREAC
jgi:predicted ATPase